VNISESTKEASLSKQRKWFIRCSQKRQRGRVGESGVISSRLLVPPLHSRHLTWRASYAELGKPILFPLGRQVVRSADNSVGKGCWKKRMQRCNDADTGLNVT